MIFVQFRKQHSRLKAILSSTVLSQQYCEVYFITEIAPLTQWRADGGRTGRRPRASKAGEHPESEIKKN